MLKRAPEERERGAQFVTALAVGGQMIVSHIVLTVPQSDADQLTLVPRTKHIETGHAQLSRERFRREGGDACDGMARDQVCVQPAPIISQSRRLWTTFDCERLQSLTRVSLMMRGDDGAQRLLQINDEVLFIRHAEIGKRTMQIGRLVSAERIGDGDETHKLASDIC